MAGQTFGSGFKNGSFDDDEEDTDSACCAWLFIWKRARRPLLQPHEVPMGDYSAAIMAKKPLAANARAAAGHHPSPTPQPPELPDSVRTSISSDPSMVRQPSGSRHSGAPSNTLDPPPATPPAASALAASSDRGSHQNHRDLDTLQALVDKKHERAWNAAIRAEQQAFERAGPDPAAAQKPRFPPPGLDPFEQQLWAGFVLADRDGNGMLSRWEFTRALQAAGAIAQESDARKEWARIDTDHSGYIEWDEFCTLGRRRHTLAKLADKLRATPDTVERATLIIQRSLRSRRSTGSQAGSRPPSRNLSGKATARAGTAMSSQEEEEEWAARLRAEERKSNMEQRGAPPTPPRPPPRGLDILDQKLWASFVLADRDRSGQLSRREFTLALQAAGVIKNESEAREEWARVDADNSGTIDWEEFRALGQRCQVLACLPERLRANAERAVSAATVIQRSFGKSKKGGTRVVHDAMRGVDGDLKQRQVTARV